MVRSEAADERIFEDVYICMKCNARNKLQDPEDANCRKCGYSGLRPKHKDIEATG
ncbi:MAG: 50S ribosomal protein L40e [Candidatus Nanohaloarchaea archaeon]|nr:50S ribosomal protein L40e [Candidatus Nanohaloarchaea archaeon]